MDIQFFRPNYRIFKYFYNLSSMFSRNYWQEYSNVKGYHQLTGMHTRVGNLVGVTINYY